MSYEIEFSGSTVDRENVSQLTANSSLVKNNSVFLTDARHEFSGGFQLLGWFDAQNNFFGGNGAYTLAIDDYNTGGRGIYLVNGGVAVTPRLQGDGTITSVLREVDTGGIFFAGMFFAINLPISNLQYTLEWRARAQSSNNTAGGTAFLYLTIPNVGNNLFTTFPADTNWYSGTHSVTIGTGNAPNFSLGFVSSGNPGQEGRFVIDYLRLSSGSTVIVSINSQTITEGVAPVGGSPIIINTQTLQNGSNAIASPSKLFGLRVNDAATKKLEASYNPSADDNEDSYIDASDAKIITAESTSLSVESFGTGAPEYIQRGSSIEVKDVSNLTEN